MKRKLGKWLAVTAMFAIIPLLFDCIVLYEHQVEIRLNTVFSQSSTYLIGFGICASGFGDALYESKVSGYIDGRTITVILFSVIVMILGALLYAAKKGAVLTDGDINLSLVYVVSATVVSFVTVLVSAK